MKYKVYLDSRFIVLSSQPDRMQKYCLFHKYHDLDDLYVKISNFLTDNKIYNLNIYSYKSDSLWKAFKSFFEIHIAAGGLLCDESKKLLFIMRRGRWDIPKGHIAGDESIKECAVREIEEETGLIPDEAIKVLQPTYHIYRLKDKWVLKETNWFIFKYSGKGTASPQEEEDITELKWTGIDQLNTIHRNTWSSLSDVINEAVVNISDH